MSLNNRAIGLFDSGIGGLTVMRQMMNALPKESLIYFGDTARLPYGEKNSERIVQYSIENANFLISQEIKLLVIACHTSSAYAVHKLRQQFSIPIIEIIEPSVEKVTQFSQEGAIAILATRGTILSNAYEKSIRQKHPNKTIFSVACPLLVPLIEENWSSHPATRLIIREYLEPLKTQNVDTVLLGCTHYPLLRDIIQEELGQKPIIVDSAQACVEQVSHLLTQQNLHTTNVEVPFHRYFVSDDPKKFKGQAEGILSRSLDHVHLKC
jgi:glutamate racemase